AAAASRDRFGAFAHWRWQVALERCRNGRPGHWTLEWDHVAYRLRLAEVVADRAPAAGDRQAFRRTV
ncbi:MAG TPA: ImuA protein, partial [Vineibacter sp.]|nr:ImuA protein [Vineibacter sp.]